MYIQLISCILKKIVQGNCSLYRCDYTVFTVLLVGVKPVNKLDPI